MGETDEQKSDKKDKTVNEETATNESFLLLLVLKSIEKILGNQDTIIKKLDLLKPKEEIVNGE